MQKPYSRLAKIEEGKQTKTALKFLLLSIVLVAFLFFLGVPLLARLTSFVVDSDPNSQNIDPGDTTPPAPPRISELPLSTKEQDIRVEGTTEAGSTVSLYVNGVPKEFIADASGIFSTKVDLAKGENEIYAVSTDINGNESQDSKRYTVIVDNEPPKVEITKPKDGESFSGSKQKQITIEGTTESGATLTINGRVAITNSNGTFVFPTTLGDGENNFNIKSTDQAGNMTEMDVKVTYSP